MRGLTSRAPRTSHEGRLSLHGLESCVFREAGIAAKVSPIIEKLSEGQGLSLNYLTLIQDFARRARADMKFSRVKQKKKS